MNTCPCSKSCTILTHRYFAAGHDARFAARHREPGETAFKAASRLKRQYGNLEKAQTALEGPRGMQAG